MPDTYLDCVRWHGHDPVECHFCKTDLCPDNCKWETSGSWIPMYFCDRYWGLAEKAGIHEKLDEEESRHCAVVKDLWDQWTKLTEDHSSEGLKGE